MRDIKLLMTHGGVFHADEVFATAFLWLLGCKAPVRRVSEMPDKIPQGTLVYDIGGGPYDHHGTKKTCHDDGIPFASFGLIVRDFWKYTSKPQIRYYKEFEKAFVEDIDTADNGLSPSTMSNAITCFNPTWKEGSDRVNELFQSAVSVAMQILRYQICRQKDYFDGKVCFNAEEVFYEVLKARVSDELTEAELADNSMFHQNKMPYGRLSKLAKKNWRKLFTSEEDCDSFIGHFLRHIEYSVQYEFPNDAFVNSINLFSPFVWENAHEEQIKARFQDAFQVCSKILDRQLISYNDDRDAEAEILARAEITTGHVMFLDQHMPVNRFLVGHENIHWVCFPTFRNDYALVSIRESNNTRRAYYPKEFCGKKENQLPDGMKFCHPGGFFGSFKDMTSVRNYIKQYID